MPMAESRAFALLEPISCTDNIAELCSALAEKKICSVYGPDDTQRAHFLAALAAKSGRHMLILTPNDGLAMRMTEDLNVMLDGCARFLHRGKRCAAAAAFTRGRGKHAAGAGAGNQGVLHLPEDGSAGKAHRLKPNQLLRGS